MIDHGHGAVGAVPALDDGEAALGRLDQQHRRLDEQTQGEQPRPDAEDQQRGTPRR
jgi:hypothetical protein